MIVIAVKLVVAPADAEAFEARLKKHAANSLTQSGCLGFSIARDRENKGAYHLWEVYKDMAAFEEHKNADFMEDWRVFSAPLIKERQLAVADQVV